MSGSPGWRGLLTPELSARSVGLNDQPLRREGEFVVVWLQQTLRGIDHPAIDVGACLANAGGVPVLVYHGLRCDYPYASARLSRFILGASAAMGRDLAQRGIQCVNLVQQSAEHGKGMVYRLAERAQALITDQHFTFVPLSHPRGPASALSIPVIAVDSARVVPIHALPERVATTAAFRRAHTPLRAPWALAREPVSPQVTRPIDGLPEELTANADLSEAQLDDLVAALPIDHSLTASAEFPATAQAADEALARLDASFVRRYPAVRNNPAVEHGTAQISPYLRFGMLSPWQVYRQVCALDVSPSQRSKFLDELLTWREWSHWRLWRQPALMRYRHLPEWARSSLGDHRQDPRESVLSLPELAQGRTPDPVWNAAQKQWLCTGWMHNNLRMYWAAQLLRWTPTPEHAWAVGCYLNDKLSLDGRDPATYVSMRWCFGEGRPGHRELPVYGRLPRKSSAALMRRPGMAPWVESWQSRPCPVPDLSDAVFDRYL